MTIPARCTSDRGGIAVVVDGRWHDMDSAREELLALTGAHDAAVCTVHTDFSDVETIAAADAVVAYTCDVRPSALEAEALQHMLSRGGRLLGLHATNSAIDPPTPGGPRVFRTPDAMPEFTALLGNRFLAHPKIAPFLIEVVRPEHPLVVGVGDFTITDEIYVSELAGDLDVLLDVAYDGPCPGFETDHALSPRQPVLFTRPEGAGRVTYLTLGHCRGRFDLADLGIADLGVLDRVAWESAQYREVLRRCMAWAVHGDGWQDCPVEETS
ncbi:MAG: ThuA domain-containing protein [Actinobacteria bacterium]|nr:ThuA domain-containing protein [Actinomycetota bacterium]